MEIIYLRPARSTGRDENRRATETTMPTASLSFLSPRYIAAAAAATTTTTTTTTAAENSTTPGSASVQWDLSGSRTLPRPYPHHPQHLFILLLLLFLLAPLVRWVEPISPFNIFIPMARNSTKHAMHAKTAECHKHFPWKFIFLIFNKIFN